MWFWNLDPGSSLFCVLLQTHPLCRNQFPSMLSILCKNKWSGQGETLLGFIPLCVLFSFVLFHRLCSSFLLDLFLFVLTVSLPSPF